jgi:DNA polymerase-3 subunit gamma/tau
LKTAQIERALAGFLDLHRDIRYSVNPRYELELYIARLCALTDWIAPEELARAVDGLRSAVASKGSMAQKKETPRKELKIAPSAESVSESVGSGEIVEDPRKLRELVAASIQSSNIILAKSLAKSTSWEIKEGSLIIALPGEYEVSLARQESEVIAAKVCALGGRALRIEFRVDAIPANDTALGNAAEGTLPGTEDPVLLVERTFRGKRVAVRENARTAGTGEEKAKVPDIET